MVIFIGEIVLLALIACVILLVQAVSGLILGGARLALRKRGMVWIKRLSTAFLVLFIVTLIAVLLVNLLFFEVTARGVMDILHERTGVEIKFEKAEGNLFSGTTTLHGVTIRRMHHKTSTFDLRADVVDLDLDMTSLLTFRPRIESLKLKGVKGKFHRKAKVWRTKPRKAFTVEEFSLEDIALNITDSSREGPPFDVTLTVKKFHTAPFRSKLAIFDILFHSSGSGALNGSPMVVETEETGNITTCRWRLDDFPLELAAAYIRGPFKYISRARIDIDIHGKRDKGGYIDTDWSMWLREIDAVPADDSSSMTHKTTYKIVQYLDRNAPEIPVRFHLQFRDDDFKNAVSLEGAGIWKRSGKMILSIVFQLAKQSKDQIKEKLKEWGKKSWTKIKSIFKKGD